MFTRSMHLTKQYKKQRWQDSYLFFEHDKVQSSKILCQIVLFQRGLRSSAIPLVVLHMMQFYEWLRLIVAKSNFQSQPLIQKSEEKKLKK